MTVCRYCGEEIARGLFDDASVYWFDVRSSIYCGSPLDWVLGLGDLTPHSPYERDQVIRELVAVLRQGSALPIGPSA